MTQENYDAVRKGIWFSIEIENEEFLAFVSEEALRIHFEASKTRQGQLSAFKQNRERIISVARRRFLERIARPVKLRAEDFDSAESRSSAARSRAVG
jgi:hypothetical protein